MSLDQLTTAIVKERTCSVMRSEKVGHEVHPRSQNLKIFVVCEEISQFQLTIFFMKPFVWELKLSHSVTSSIVDLCYNDGDIQSHALEVMGTQRWPQTPKFMIKLKKLQYLSINFFSLTYLRDLKFSM